MKYIAYIVGSSYSGHSIAIESEYEILQNYFHSWDWAHLDEYDFPAYTLSLEKYKELMKKVDMWCPDNDTYKPEDHDAICFSLFSEYFTVDDILEMGEKSRLNMEGGYANEWIEVEVVDGEIVQL